MGIALGIACFQGDWCGDWLGYCNFLGGLVWGLAWGLQFSGGMCLGLGIAIFEGDWFGDWFGDCFLLQADFARHILRWSFRGIGLGIGFGIGLGICLGIVFLDWFGDFVFAQDVLGELESDIKWSQWQVHANRRFTEFGPPTISRSGQMPTNCRELHRAYASRPLWISLGAADHWINACPNIGSQTCPKVWRARALGAIALAFAKTR